MGTKIIIAFQLSYCNNSFIIIINILPSYRNYSTPSDMSETLLHVFIP